MAETEQNSLFLLLKEVQLEHFYHAIKSIDVTKVEHFENVVFEDLTSPQVGMGPPAARRLLEAAKKRNNKWKKNLFNIILPAKPSTSKDKDERPPSVTTGNSRFMVEADASSESAGLTCLISNKDIKLLDKIGDGSFGVVMRAQWTQPNKSVKYVAVKILKQEVILRALEDFAKEVNSMHQLKHPNLIKLFGIVLSSPMMMVTELAEQGSLRSKLVKTLGRISLSTLVDYAVQIANGMEYLETKRLIHRDLATRNIFITESNAIKIGDFGLMRSVPFGEDYYTMSDNVKVPFPWCAIESLKFRQFSHASDTWMYGVTLWEIFSFGQEPWAGLNGSQIIKKLEQNERLSIPNACSQRVYSVMNLCWKAEPKERPTFESMINFFKNTKPIRLKALSDFESGSSKFANYLQKADGGDKTYLKVASGDEIEVVEGLSENYWWKGQNQRSFDIGLFPRCIAKDLRSLNRNDISKPLKNSFIHTGHMDPMGKKSWGNPEFIEKMYLEHPIEPPDVLGFETNNNLLPLDLETRGGEKTHVNGNEKKLEISKIVSIEELDEKDNLGFESNFKEDILIDFNSEVPDATTAASQSKDFFSTHNDLAGLNFEEFKVFDSAPTNSSSNNNHSSSRITRDIFEMDDEPEVAPKFEAEAEPQPRSQAYFSEKYDSDNFKFEAEPSMSFPESVSGTFPQPTAATVGASLSICQAETFVSSSSKYYSPPTESGLLETQSIKNRYYSSVCSNCDFTAPEPVPVPYNSYLAGQSSCQCCSDFFSPCSTNSYMPNSHCFNGGCSDLCTSQPQAEYFPPADALPPPPPPPELDSTSSQVAVERPNAYQTTVCKEFIKELEANFARLGQVKLSDGATNGTNGSATVYPTINPPPRPYKTRRPAPPPPTQKKVN